MRTVCLSGEKIALEIIFSCVASRIWSSFLFRQCLILNLYMTSW